MKQGNIRFNLVITNEMKESINRIAVNEGEKATTLVKSILQNFIKKYEKKMLRDNLVNGYKYLAEEHKQISNEFKYIDSEGWEE